MSLRHRLIGRPNKPVSPEEPFVEKVRKARLWHEHRTKLITGFHREQIVANEEGLDASSKVLKDYEKAWALDAKIRLLLPPDPARPNIIIVDAFAKLAKPLEDKRDPRPAIQVRPSNAFMLDDLNFIEQNAYVEALYDNLKNEFTDGITYKFTKGAKSSYAIRVFEDDQNRTSYHITDLGSGGLSASAGESSSIEYYVLLSTAYRPLLRYADGENLREDQSRYQAMEVQDVLTLAADMFATESN